MNLSVFTYHAALGELERAAQTFSEKIRLAAEASKHVEEGEDLVALRTLDSIRTCLLTAFADHPGMIQVFSSEGK